jgi:phospholipid/cholesterol/gamma-HCH transport system substrate-binding protein
MGNFSKTTASLNRMLDPKTGSVSATMSNLESFSGNLKNNNEKITGILTNAEKTTSALANGQLDKTLLELQQMVTRLNETIGKLNSTDGSLGLLMNDKKAYNNLQNSLGNLNKLLEDLRVNPKRYVHFSLFGKKSKAQPLPSDTAKAQ